MYNKQGCIPTERSRHETEKPWVQREIRSTFAQRLVRERDGDRERKLAQQLPNPKNQT